MLLILILCLHRPSQQQSTSCSSRRSPTFAVTSDLEALDDCSTHHLKGRGHIVAAPHRVNGFRAAIALQDGGACVEVST